MNKSNESLMNLFSTEGFPNLGSSLTIEPPLSIPQSKKKIELSGVNVIGDEFVYNVDNFPSPQELIVTPISTLQSNLNYQPGNSIAINDLYTSYAVYTSNAINIRIIDKHTSIRGILKDHSDVITDMQFLRNDMNIIASSDKTGKLIVWKIEQLQSLTITTIFDTIINPIAKIAWHPVVEEQILATLEANEEYFEVKLWKIQEKSQIQKATIKQRDASSFCFSPDGEFIAVGAGKYIIILKSDTLLEVKRWIAHETPIFSILYCGTNKLSAKRNKSIVDDFLITGANNNKEIKLWDVPSSICIQTITFESKLVSFRNLFHMDETGSVLIVANFDDNRIHMFHLDSFYKFQFDYILPTRVAQPTLSFTVLNYPFDWSKFSPTLLFEFQLYCVQPKAIQSYTIKSEYCFQPPVESFSSPPLLAKKKNHENTKPEIYILNPQLTADLNTNQDEKEEKKEEEISEEEVEEGSSLQDPNQLNLQSENFPDNNEYADTKTDMDFEQKISNMSMEETPNQSFELESTPEKLDQNASYLLTPSSFNPDETKEISLSNNTEMKKEEEEEEEEEGEEGKIFIKTGEIGSFSNSPENTSNLSSFNAAKKNFTEPSEVSEKKKKKKTKKPKLDILNNKEESLSVNSPQNPNKPITILKKNSPLPPNLGVSAPISISPPKEGIFFESENQFKPQVTPVKPSKFRKEFEEEMKQTKFHKSYKKENPQEIDPLIWELKRIETNIISKNEKMGERLYQRLEKERQERENQRQEAFLKAISDVVTVNMEHALQKVLHKELQQLVVPEIVKILIQTIDSSLFAPMKEHLNFVISENLNVKLETMIKGSVNKSITSKEISAEITKALQSSLTLAISEIVATYFQNRLIPAFEQSCQNMFLQIHSSFEKGIQTSKKTILDIPRYGIYGNDLKNGKLGFQKISTETETVQRIESSLKQLQSSVDNLNTNSYSNDNSSKPSRQTVFVKKEEKFQLKNEVSKYLREGQYEKAFSLALNSRNIDLVVWLCSKVNPNDVLRSGILSPYVILSLIQQLGFDLTRETANKLNWLREATLVLPANDSSISSYCPTVLNKVHQNLEDNYPKYANTELGPSFKVVLHIINSLLNTK